MCGIAGFVRTAQQPAPVAEDRELLGRMCTALVHRGPDSRGIYSDGAVGLGHARLSIIDLEGGAQPLASEDRKIQAICNGEIYNYRELRRDLIGRGHRFRSNSDSEVLVHLYEEVGDELPNTLIGMFAFAVWDGRRCRLLLGRDRLGQKPLYYSTDERGYSIVFGSELKALAAFDDRKREVSPEAAASYLALGYVPDPMTIYRDVRKLEPASCLSVEGQSVRSWRYWQPSFEVRSSSFRDATAELESLLAESVRLRMVADVPVGAFLSGGVDSSATASMMAESATDPIHTFSIGFEDTLFDERPFALQMAERIGSKHVADVLAGPYPRLIERFAEAFDEPFGDSSALPTLRVSELARRDVTVALSGDGADEIFGGYKRYSRELLKERLRGPFPAAVRASLAAMGDAEAPAMRATNGWGRLRAGATDVFGSPADSYFRAMATYHDGDVGRLLAPDLPEQLGGWRPSELFREQFAKTKGLPLLSRLQACDLAFYLPGDILAKVDRASMAHSLELRSPWLDHRIVEFAGRLPPAFKAVVTSRKRIVRRMLRSRVPRSLLDRRKMGFAIPVGRWLSNELRPLFEWAIAQPEADEILDREEVRRIAGSYNGREGRAASQAWFIFALALWACRHRGRRAIDWGMVRGSEAGT